MSIVDKTFKSLTLAGHSVDMALMAYLRACKASKKAKELAGNVPMYYTLDLEMHACPVAQALQTISLDKLAEVNLTIVKYKQANKRAEEARCAWMKAVQDDLEVECGEEFSDKYDF